MTTAAGPYWVGILQDDDDSSTRPAEIFEGSEEQMRAFIKSRYKRQLGNVVGDIEDADFAPREWGFAIFDLTKYLHLYIYRFERKHTSHEGGRMAKRGRRSTRRHRIRS